jgi:hypothetical protein
MVSKPVPYVLATVHSVLLPSRPQRRPEAEAVAVRRMRCSGAKANHGRQVVFRGAGRGRVRHRPRVDMITRAHVVTDIPATVGIPGQQARIIRINREAKSTRGSGEHYHLAAVPRT